MTLTPATLRLDLKCGRGAISEGEKCTKGLATRVASNSRTTTTSKSKRLTSERQKARRRALTTLAIGAGIIGVSALGVQRERAARREREELLNRLAVQLGPTQQRVRSMEQSQRSVANANRANPSSDFMRGFSANRPAPARPAAQRRPWKPPAGSVDAKVQAAFTSTARYSTTSNRNPNPDVSAAWVKPKESKSRKPYRGDPDLSGVWARGFQP
jgi:hypothetical protein